MRKRLSAVTKGTTAILLLLAACSSPLRSYGCTDPLGCLEIPAGGPVVIGTLLATTGDYAPIGLDSQRGVELAVAEQGDLFGHEISLTHQSTDCTEANARLAAIRLAEDPLLVAVIGPTCSEEALAAAPILSAAGVVVLSPSAQVQVDVPGYFRVVYPASLEDPAVDFALGKLQVSSIVVITDGSLDSVEETSLFAESLGSAVKAARNSSLRIASYPSTDFQDSLAQVTKNQPDLIYLSVPPFQAGQLVAQIRSTPGLEVVPLLGDERLFSPEFYQSAGNSAQGIYLVGPDSSRYMADYAGFLTAYQNKYNQAPPSIYHAFAFDAVRILLEAIERSATEDQSGTLIIPRTALRQAAVDTQDIAGLTGLVRCYPDRSCYSPSLSLAVYQIIWSNEGAWVPGINPLRIYP
jgi:branched-chain amino acid transport system substrate-binding protein